MPCHEIYENEEKLEQVRRKFYGVFEDLKNRDRIEVVDAFRTVEQIHEDIVGRIQTL